MGLSDIDDYPPECPAGQWCCQCHKCYLRYIQLKWEGALDG